MILLQQNKKKRVKGKINIAQEFKWCVVEMRFYLRSEPSFVRITKPSSRSFWSFLNKTTIENALPRSFWRDDIGRVENLKSGIPPSRTTTLVIAICTICMSSRTHVSMATSLSLTTPWLSGSHLRGHGWTLRIWVCVWNGVFLHNGWVWEGRGWKEQRM